MELSINTKLEIQHLKVSIYHLKQKHFLVFFGIFWIYSPLKQAVDVTIGLIFMVI